MARNEFERIVRANRRQQLIWTRQAVERIDAIYRNAARDVARKLRDTVGDQVLTRQYLSTLLGDLERILGDMATDYNSALGIHLIGAAQLAIDREADIARRLVEQAVIQKILDGFVRSMTREVTIGAIGRVTVTFGRVAEQAVEATFRRVYTDGLTLSDRLWRMDALTRRQMGDLMTQAVAEQKSARELAKELRGYLTETGEANGRYNAMRLARTEISTAHREGHIQAATGPDGELRPWISAIGWRLSASHPRPDVCCRRGTMVETIEGPKPIQSVQVGDKVLTHTGCYMPVTRLYRRTIPAGSLVRLHFRVARNRTADLVLTPNHPVLTGEGWTPATDLQTGCCLTSAVSVQNERAHHSFDDVLCRASLDFGGSEPSRHVGSTSLGRCGERQPRERRKLRIAIPDALSPIWLCRFAGDIYRYLHSRLSRLDCQGQGVTRRAWHGLLRFAGTYQDAVFRSWDSLIPCAAGIEPSSTAALAVRRTACRRFRKSGDLFDTRQASTHSSSISDQGHSPWLGRSSGRQDKRDCGVCSSIAPSTSDCKSVVSASGMGDRFRRRVGRAVSHSIRRLSARSSYIYYSLACGKSPGRLLSAEPIPTLGETVYNLGVAGDNSYFASGIAVHNCDVWASQDVDGLGPGNYLPANVPVDHPHGLCMAVSILKQHPDMQFISKEAQPKQVPQSQIEAYGLRPAA